jgi:hypothetical protein
LERSFLQNVTDKLTKPRFYLLLAASDLVHNR